MDQKRIILLMFLLLRAVVADDGSNSDHKSPDDLKADATGYGNGGGDTITIQAVPIAAGGYSGTGSYRGGVGGGFGGLGVNNGDGNNNVILAILAVPLRLQNTGGQGGAKSGGGSSQGGGGYRPWWY
ncbi:glycine-rich cell wall structural protein 1.0-like [Limulus polyphemus]|uniref:Glycine-rich cell wall structural protein 1.0-like n=1 Tax=Limulus polyphemus TaxID=6850 RepID=A0ABM1B7C1_LIMPO|nr:glycine-rich cell wall structural protein 1.0-like [Limulus polyphemus]